MIELIAVSATTVISLVLAIALTAFKRSSVADESQEGATQQKSHFKQRVSQVTKRFSITSHTTHRGSHDKRKSLAKRVSDGFMGLISKAYTAKPVEPDYSSVDFFSNPLKQHISEAVSAIRDPSSTIELISAIRTLGHISVTGGNETSGYIGKFIIPDLAAKLKNPLEDFEVKIAAVEAISEMCAYCMTDNQNLCREYGILSYLIKGLRNHSTNKELLRRQWCAHALYYCITNNVESSNFVRKFNINLDLENLVTYMHPDDSMWEFNDADMLLDMMRH